MHYCGQHYLQIASIVILDQANMAGVDMSVFSDSRLRVSRRGFLKASGVTAASAAATTGMGAIPFAASRAAAQDSWDAEHDIVVVGSGGAAFAAAIIAKVEGADVAMFEKGAYVGGTTLASGGGAWFPNNVTMQRDGIEDNPEDALKYMARYSYPAQYNPDGETLGLPADVYENLSTYVATSPDASAALEEAGAITWTYGRNFGPNFDQVQVDYMDHFEENLQPTHRTLHPSTEEGEPAGGGEMIAGYQAWAEENGIGIHLLHRVDNVIVNANNQVIGVEVTVLTGDEGTESTPEATPVATPASETRLAIRARKGVIFGSGGFGRNEQMMMDLVGLPYYGGCSAPTNEGDLMRIATTLGARVGNLHNVWRNNSVFEQGVAASGAYNCTWFLNGDSFIIVNRNGRRFMNEKRSYQDRPMGHFDYDPNEADWTSRLGFWIYDQRVQDNWGGMFPLPADPTTAPYVVSGDTMEELAAAIAERVDSLAHVTGSFKLHENFASNLVDEVERFNGFAASGVDEDFQRGERGYDVSVPYGPMAQTANLESYPSDDQPNVAMYPLTAEGPYYAFIVSPAAVDTNGGPVINSNAQIVRWDNTPIEGLYGAGNAVASTSVNAYWGGGATLGNATVWGYQAARHAVASEEKPIS